MLASFPRLVAYWAKSAGQAQFCRQPNTRKRTVADQIRWRGGGLWFGTRFGPTGNGHAFILRDVTLAGVDSVWAPREKREEAWGRLSTDLDSAKLDSMTARARLDDVPSLANEILAGNIKGRMVIDL